MDDRTMGGGGTRIRPVWIAAAGLAVVALVAFRVPLASLLYVGILLLCPLLMAGMHGGHGGHGGQGQADGHAAHAREPDGLGSPDPRDVGSQDGRAPEGRSLT